MAGEAAEIIGGSKSASSSFVGDTASSGDVIDRDLLSHLVRHAELAHALWGETGGDIATLHTHFSVLRSIIDRPFEIKLLHTVHGFGYRIAENADA